MTFFQLLMLGASAFFAFKIYEHIQTLKDDEDDIQHTETDKIESLISQADDEMQNGDFQKALAIYSEANYKLPNNAEILFKMGFALMQQDRVDEAIEYYQDTLKLDDNSPAIHQALASAYRTQGNFEKAKYHLDSSLLINDKNPITYYNYGNLLVDMKEFEDAKEMYQQALELDSDFKEAKEELEKIS
ncbi:tetratricopeptide repeat protein [Sulfurimonas microaerophilic]|uniref:tetratricopeptide repeat protein n=1 Tax=Sulfurimonas microaerophilic TaxID=3058392 RepID=UPI0027152411|nr:tetratricopeptide repeat protein [Sulfurimonas sp. hsl 1-7]